MNLSKNGEQFIHGFEICKLEAYPDPGSRDGTPWTIGWGHTGSEVVKGLVWTQQQADSAFLHDAAWAIASVTKSVKIPVTQGQFDALIAFCFNVGKNAFEKSTLLRKLNNFDFDGARAEFAKWNKNDGKVMLGLRRRRFGEQLLWDGLSAADALKQARALK
ncbi:MAG: lysozyme [Aeromonas veronii]